MIRDLFDLFVGFTQVGVFGFGGGPSMIPLVQIEVVEVRGWLSREEFLDAFAFGNALPGPITTKLAGYVGYQVAGWPGVFSALLGMTFPTILMMLALAALYARYRDTPVVANFLRGVRPVVVALLAFVVWDFAPSAFGAPPDWLRALPLWGIAFAALALSLRYKAHPALLIVAGGVVGLLLGA